MTTFQLRDYQIQGVEFLQKNKRAMLLDWPGLGKTAQAAFAAKPPTLIICPNYLVGQWKDWLTGEDEASLARNKGEVISNVSGSVVAALGNRQERINALESGADWVICNVEMLNSYSHFDIAKDKDWIKQFRTIVFDESHHLKSHTGQRAKLAVKFAKYAEYVFLLTATPVKREIDDFFMQFRIISPDVFTSYWRFVNMFCVTEQNYFGTQILGAKRSMLPELQKIISTVSLGRSYKEVGRALPPITQIDVPIILNEKTRKVYDEIVDYWRLKDEESEQSVAFTNYMQIMHVLRQHLTGALKADTVKDLIEDSTGKSVIFSWYQNTAEAIANAVPNSTLITGQIQDANERRRLAMNGHNISATISSLSEGVDLSSARNVVFAETDWTPGSNYQALSRVRRERLEGNNDEPIIVYYVYCKRTIDEVILKTANGRSATVKEIVKESLYL